MVHILQPTRMLGQQALAFVLLVAALLATAGVIGYEIGVSRASVTTPVASSHSAPQSPVVRQEAPDTEGLQP